MAIIILPQLGSSPAIAVLTKGEFAIEKAIFFASISFLHLLTFTVINLEDPSPSDTTLFAKFNKTLFKAKSKHQPIKNINDIKIKDFDVALHSVLLSLAKRIAADGEGASKFITIKVGNSKNQEDAKKIAFSIANSPLVKTAIAGKDPNWG